MTSISQFINPDTEKLDATLIADYVAHEPTILGRGVDGDLYEYREGIFVRSEKVITQRVAKALGGRYSTSVRSQVEDHMLNVELPDVGLPDLPAGYLEYIVVENGIYWWRDDQLEDHSAGLGALSKLPIEFDRGAIPHTFIEWMKQVLGDDEDMHRHLWEVIGYMLMTGNPLQKIFLLYGPGGNGKGTLLRLLRHLLGRNNYSSISMHQLVDDRFATSGLYGKIANISGDLSARFLSDPQVLKEITGGDSINASRKFGQSFEFVPYAVPIFASNEYFRTSDSSSGWRRRWEVLEFTRNVISGTAFDEQALLDDAPGIFNYAMNGLRDLMQRGRFDPPASAQEATQRLHDEADPVMMWLDDDELVVTGPDELAPRADIYKRYVKWCRSSGYTPLAVGPFGKRLAQAGYGSTRPRSAGARSWHYTGLSLASYGWDDEE
ncbi:hypothetical protein GCM10010922_01340 [Microbacterium sorbitolivorans]|nr:phage/plasmid primase, P4 family [Microbacterium sorbitolivorans]GGF30136.1 hypothetical protein GCM10010922_01340 [Microbacterium sorbitolivorans]